MFARSDFGSPSAPPPIHQDRLVGGLVLAIGVVLLVLVVISADQTVFIPHNATLAVTHSYETQHPATPTGTAATRPRPTTTPPGKATAPPFNQQARELPP